METDYELLQQAYIALLRLPIGKFRIENQAILCALRNEIARLTGQNSKDVQDTLTQHAESMGIGVPYREGLG